MKRIFFVLLVLVFARAEALEEIDHIVLELNDTIILESDIKNYKKFLETQTKLAGQNIEIDNQILMNSLIDMMLQYNIANKIGIQITEAELNDFLQNTALKFHTSVSGLRSKVSRFGGAEAWANYLYFSKIQFTNFYWQQVMISQKLKISNQEIDSQINIIFKPLYYLTYILVYSNTPAARKKEMLDIFSKNMASGSDLTKGLTIASDEGRVVKYDKTLASDLPTVISTNLPSSINTYTVTENDNGINIVYLKDLEKSSLDKKMQLAKYSQILISINPLLSDRDAKAQLQKIKKSIQRGEITFEDAAKVYSTNINNNLSGGAVDWVDVEQLGSVVAQVIKSSKIGEITDPFRDKDGWNILRIEGKKQEQISENQLRSMIKNTMFQQRVMGELERTLNDLRSQAYINYIDKSYEPR